jgi:hypothetical protein
MSTTDALIQTVLDDAVVPALAMLPKKMDTDDAKVQLLTTGLQESRLLYPYQRTNIPGEKGPARGLCQMERFGGVKGVMTHWASKEYAREVCLARNTPWDIGQVWAALEFDPILAFAFARLLYYTDANHMPLVTDTHKIAWDSYIFNWRPGKPHPETWNEFRNQALAVVLL